MEDVEVKWGKDVGRGEGKLRRNFGMCLRWRWQNGVLDFETGVIFLSHSWGAESLRERKCLIGNGVGSWEGEGELSKMRHVE